MRAVHPHLLKNISRKSYVALLPVLPDEAKINVFGVSEFEDVVEKEERITREDDQG